MRSLGELLEKGDVGIVLDADVRDAEALERDARGAHAKRPPRILLRIESCGLEDRGMHHAAAEDFDPAGLLAGCTPRALADLARHIHLGARLREGEEARTKARLRLAEEVIREIREPQGNARE